MTVDQNKPILAIHNHAYSVVSYCLLVSDMGNVERQGDDMTVASRMMNLAAD